MTTVLEIIIPISILFQPESFFSEAENGENVFLIHLMLYKTDFKAIDENPK